VNWCAISQESPCRIRHDEQSPSQQKDILENETPGTGQKWKAMFGIAEGRNPRLGRRREEG
jgi:hypothetical protein